MNKKTLSERYICTKFITPALEKAGWDKQLQILEEVSFTDGKIYVRGKITAKGTGKTHTAFQIIHRIWKSGAKKRILFLADRKALIGQTRRGDFKHFKDKMTVVKHRQIDKSFEIFLALYQGLSGTDEAAKSDRKQLACL